MNSNMTNTPKRVLNVFVQHVEKIMNNIFLRNFSKPIKSVITEPRSLVKRCQKLVKCSAIVEEFVEGRAREGEESIVNVRNTNKSIVWAGEWLCLGYSEPPHILGRLFITSSHYH